MVAWFDIKKSFLVLTKDYKYSLVVILSLAFSLGVTLFLFEQIYTIRYKPLEFDHPEKIVSITRHENGWGYTTGGIFYYDFIYYNTRQTSFEYLARYEDRLATLQTDQFSERVQGAAVNAELFKVTEGANPILSVAKMAKSVDYYVNVLGFENADWAGDDFTLVTRDGAGIYLCEGDQGHPGTWVWIG